MICFPNAKINLGLNIVSKREDGYHNLETIFYPIGIKDALEVIVNKGQITDSFIQNGLQVDTPSEDNLVMRALRLMRESYEFPALEIHLLKKIPFGAGLGGGSSDASFTLRLINDTFALGATDHELASMAVKLGADCPFFIYNRPMFASGIGEILKDVDVSLRNYIFVVIKPDIFISTKDAFSKITPAKPAISLLDVVKHPLAEWKNLMVNDFEISVFSKCKEIELIKARLYSEGALYASMSGSGSSVLGIFDMDIKSIQDIFPTCYVWIGQGLY